MAKQEQMKKQERETRFTKEQLLKSIGFRNNHDSLTAVLAEDKQYTKKEAEKKLEEFMKGRV